MAYMENLAIVDADTSATIYTQPFSHARCPRSTKGGHPLGNSSLYLKRKKKKAMKIIIDYSRHVHLGCSYGLSSFFLYFCSVIVSHEDSLSPSQLFMCLDFCITTWEKGGYLVGVLVKRGRTAWPALLLERRMGRRGDVLEEQMQQKACI